MPLEYTRYKEEEEVLVLIAVIKDKVSYCYSNNILIRLIRNIVVYREL
jgi:hypothetical protein